MFVREDVECLLAERDQLYLRPKNPQVAAEGENKPTDFRSPWAASPELRWPPASGGSQRFHVRILVDHRHRCPCMRGDALAGQGSQSNEQVVGDRI